MAKPNFFNDNENRSFPFVRGSVGIGTPATGALSSLIELPDSYIVDCGFIMGPESGFNDATDYIYLYKISRLSADLLAFEFRASTATLQNTPIVFYRDVADGDFVTSFVESDAPVDVDVSVSGSVADSISESAAACGEPYWSGYLVTGRVQDVLDRMPSHPMEIIRSGDTQTKVLPALIQNLNNAQVVSVNVANGDRTRANTAIGCPDYSWPYATGINRSELECLQGDVKFSAGYNMSIIQDVETNTLRFFPVISAGLGEPCEQVKLFDSEVKATGHDKGGLEGGFLCNEIFRTINGLEGPNIQIHAGQGVNVEPDQPNNAILVNVNLSDMTQCDFASISESDGGSP